MTTIVAVAGDVMAAIVAAFCIATVYLWGKRDPISDRIRRWILTAATRQFSRPSKVFRWSMGALGTGLMLSVVFDANGLSEDWPKLIGLLGFSGTILSALFSRAAESVRYGGQTAIDDPHGPGPFWQAGRGWFSAHENPIDLVNAGNGFCMVEKDR